MKTGKVENLLINLHDKTEYIIHIKILKQVSNYRPILKKVQQANMFNQKAWLKLYIDMNTKPRKKTKNNFENGFLKLSNNAVFR